MPDHASDGDDGTSYDVHKIFAFFDPLTPCSHLELMAEVWEVLTRPIWLTHESSIGSGPPRAFLSSLSSFLFLFRPLEWLTKLLLIDPTTATFHPNTTMVGKCPAVLSMTMVGKCPTVPSNDLSQECPLLADRAATWRQGSYDLPQPSTKVSTKLAHRQLSNWPVKMTNRHTHSVIVLVDISGKKVENLQNLLVAMLVKRATDSNAISRQIWFIR